MTSSSVAVNPRLTAQISKAESLLLPLRAKSHPPHGSNKVARQGKQGDALDIAELCKRLEAVQKERRAVDRQTARRVAETSPSKETPYHHVPRNAAKAFTRTTTSESQMLRSSRLFSPDLASSVRVGIEARHKDGKRMSLGPARELTGSELKSWRPSSVAPKHTTAFPDRSGLAHYPILTASASTRHPGVRNIKHGRSVEGSDGHVFEYLPGPDQGLRRLSMEDAEGTNFTVTELGLQEEIPPLAHKITRQHLEDRADWTQSDSYSNPSKPALKHWVTPLIRSFGKWSNIDSSDVSTKLCDVKKPADSKLSRRHSSFMARHFSRGIQESHLQKSNG